MRKRFPFRESMIPKFHNYLKRNQLFADDEAEDVEETGLLNHAKLKRGNT